MVTKRIIILDPAHGYDVSGKRSPNGIIHEWKWSRQFINVLKERLLAEGFSIAIPVWEEYEIGLQARIDRYNKIDHAIVTSHHLNAAGKGSNWMSARGFEIWTSRGETASDGYATKVFQTVEKAFSGQKMRPNTWDPKEVTKDPDWEANFKVLMSKHPSFLSEYLFQDNKEDVELLLDEEWNQKMIETTVDAYKQF